MYDYTQNEKNIARKEVLKSAIIALTKKRTTSTLTKRKHLRNVKGFFIKYGEPESLFAKELSDKTILKWESFYSSIVHAREASSLKIAYLSGPNPENDLEEMTKLGVLPENIWAFESEAKVYNAAVISALNSKFPFIKIFKSNVGEFFLASPQKFDIIYLDFCGPLPSSQKTLSTITKILSHHALSSPGVLITNVSLPDKDQDQKTLELLKKLVAIYLYPKASLEARSEEYSHSEGAISEGYSFEEWLDVVSTDIDYYYGQYISRLIMDLMAVIVPYQDFPQNNALYKYLFETNSSINKSNLKSSIDELYHFDEDNGGGVVISDSGMFPILWTLASLNKSYNKKDENYAQLIYQDMDFDSFAQSFLSQIGLSDSNSNKVVEDISRMHFLLGQGEGESDYYNESLTKINTVDWMNKVFPFCDLFLFHQIKEVLFRQLATPYHVNVEKTKRWRYKAKSTEMYMDMFILDECRYLYDWMPSIDMIENGMSDIQRQLSFRFVLDGIGQHRRHYNPEFFFGTACVGHNHEGFEAKSLKPRILIK